MSAQRKMSVPAAPADDDDLEAFVSGGATVSKPAPDRKAAPTRKRAPAKPKKARPAAKRAGQGKPPWEAAGDGKKQLPLFLPERTKAQLDFLNERTGVPTQRLLRELLIDAIDDRATEAWGDMQ